MIDPNNSPQATVEPLILLAALRYALGRKSYIVGAVADAIEQNLDVFNKFQLKKMHEEIAEELKDGGGGHSWDIETWQALMRRIEEVSAEKFDINIC
ncbi:MAG: hypothetical protein WCP79_10010 [Bacillota bacterium]